MLIVGVDTGGTFTDLIYQYEGSWKVVKLLSTPENPAKAVLEGLKAIAAGKRKQVVHGSTVATNAILEKKGARTALITNLGFTDIIVIGRQNRSRLYDLTYRRNPELIPRSLRFGVPGRIAHSGEELEPFDDGAAREVAQAVVQAGAISVAVSFLFSFVNPSHELRMAEHLRALGLSVSLSHQILAEFREYERTSTTVVNACVRPKMQAYISHLLEHLEEGDSLRIMQSNGGSISAQTAMKEPVRTILSGPAGGVVGAYEIGRRAGFPKLITFDMGGTSTDVSLIDGGLSLTLESSIAGYPIKTPMIDIHTVGAGGGSIAKLDSGGALAVGPESAGADPGPICYGKGENITVTDANLFLGRLVPEHFLGGKMALYPRRLEKPFQKMAKEVSLSPIGLAEGIISVANANMERAIRVISIERGFDPREFALFSFGGAGPLHAAELARSLGIPVVLIPRHPGILSAIGMLMADIVKDYSKTVMLDARRVDKGILEGYFSPLHRRAVLELQKEGVSRENIIVESFLDMRYEGQSYEIIVFFTEDFLESFELLHERMYGYKSPGREIQIVNVRVRARGMIQKPTFEEYPEGPTDIPKKAVIGERSVIFDGKPVKTPIIMRDALRSGNQLFGPALIVEYSSTTLVPPYASAIVDRFGNIVLRVGRKEGL